jgi:hypothetical protein
MLRYVETVFALATLALGVYVVMEGLSYGFQTPEGSPDSGFFPVIVGIVLCFLAVVNVIRSKVEVAEIKEVWSNKVALRALAILGGHALLILLFEVLGLVVAAACSVFLTGLVIKWGQLDRRTLLQLIATAVIAPSVLYFLFMVMLRVQPLPGIFGF